MEKYGDKILAWVISFLFLAGLYSLGHYVIKMSDTGILAMAGWLIWSDMAKTISKPDAKAS
jgi:hypothetical protein